MSEIKLKPGMTLDEAIEHCKEKVDCTQCGEEHRQLAEWLIELKNRRAVMERIVEQLDNEIEDSESNEINRAWNRALNYAIEIVQKGCEE